MNFKLANEMADRIAQGDDTCSYDELVSMCISYLLRLRFRFGFPMIPVREVINELAADAVSDAIMIKEIRCRPFTICLENTFRDRCRNRNRIFRRLTQKDILRRCEILHLPPVIGTEPECPPAEVQVLHDEEKQLFRDELEKHEPFSKKLIYQRMEGSTMREMSCIFGRAFNECKRVFWHDFYKIQERLRQRHGNEE